MNIKLENTLTDKMMVLRRMLKKFMLGSVVRLLKISGKNKKPRD